MDMTLEQRVKNHGVATAIFAATFVLPCIIAAKLLK
jgi:tryptophan synthase beta subunit